MKDADFIIGYIDDKGDLVIADQFGVKPTKHVPDTELGGKDNILAKSGSEKDKVTDISFTIPLDSKDVYDKNLSRAKHIILS